MCTNVENLNLSHGEVYSIQHYVIKFVSELRQVGDFLHQNKTDRHDITEILLKVSYKTHATLLVYSRNVLGTTIR
jgi:hypothetical protein